MKKEYTIDAKGKSLGRVASEAAAILRGKNSPDFMPNIVPNIKLTITNGDKFRVTGKKMKQKRYMRHSTYPGNLKILRMEEIVDKKGKEYLLKKAVDGMLPKNKLRKIMIKNLVIK